MKTELFRNVIQIGMVVEDLDKTLQTFESLLGIGPFRITDYPPAGEPDCQREYRGATQISLPGSVFSILATSNWRSSSR